MESEQNKQTPMLSEKEVATEETKVQDHGGDKDEMSDENDRNNSGGEDSDGHVPLVDESSKKAVLPKSSENKSKIQMDN